NVNRIYVVGTATDGSGKQIAHLIAVDPDTSDPDTTFSGDGRTSVQDPAFSADPSSIAVIGGGKIVLGLTATGSSTQAEVMRLTSGGAPDGSFSGDGIARIAISRLVSTLAVQPSRGGTFSGIGTLSNGGVAAFRVAAQGAADTSFGGDGQMSLLP